MRRLTFGTLMLLVAFLTSSCHNATDATQGPTLQAPDNLSVSVMASVTSYGYTFSFNAVEFAESYLLYGSLNNDSSTASPLAAAQFSPIGWSYNRGSSYSGKTYYFWVRAYDGRNYGKWSTSISSLLY
jgi:hypothetical protein